MAVGSSRKFLRRLCLCDCLQLLFRTAAFPVCLRCFSPNSVGQLSQVVFSEQCLPAVSGVFLRTVSAGCLRCFSPNSVCRLSQVFFSEQCLPAVSGVFLRTVSAGCLRCFSLNSVCRLSQVFFSELYLPKGLYKRSSKHFYTDLSSPAFILPSDWMVER